MQSTVYGKGIRLPQFAMLAAGVGVSGKPWAMAMDITVNMEGGTGLTYEYTNPIEPRLVSSGENQGQTSQLSITRHISIQH